MLLVVIGAVVSWPPSMAATVGRRERNRRRARPGTGTGRRRNRRRALVGMSDKGPSGWCSVGPRHEAGVRRSTARPVPVTLPVDPAGSSDPGDPVTWPPPPPPGKPFGGGTDRRSRPIPRPPEGLRGRSSTGPDPGPTRVFGHDFGRTSISPGPSTAPGRSSTGSPGSSTGSPFGCGGVVWTRRGWTQEKGPHRYERRGPFEWCGLVPRTRGPWFSATPMTVLCHTSPVPQGVPDRNSAGRGVPRPRPRDRPPGDTGVETRGNR